MVIFLSIEALELYSYVLPLSIAFLVVLLEYVAYSYPLTRCLTEPNVLDIFQPRPT